MVRISRPAAAPDARSEIRSTDLRQCRFIQPRRRCQPDSTAKAATEKKPDAAYAVAKEKCGSLADDAKATCIKEAKCTTASPDHRLEPERNRSMFVSAQTV